MINYIQFYIEDNFKNLINIGLVVFILTIIFFLTTLKNTTYKKSVAYQKYYISVYHDFIKFVLIEFFLIALESFNTGKIIITNSLGRLAVIQVALLIFSAIKHPLGIDLK